ncbi:unnamed protein product [Lactuca saligna]|uniref:Uncharacterized protein n=1 Tax=Lactuca saligna TaxID=75948 RepID=A0AA35YV04_LACSI|nr:unnamed protein product [Lactuca saligna]
MRDLENVLEEEKCLVSLDSGELAQGQLFPGLRPIKATCMDVRVEGEVKSFLETNFASYLHLGELDIEGLRQLCDNLDAEVKHLEANTS